MGNASSSKDRHDDTVDFGALCPQGIYSGPQDWNQAVVAQAIVERKLAPFYRPLEDYEEDWDDDRILAARKELPPPPPPPPPPASGSSAATPNPSVMHHGQTTTGTAGDHHSSLAPHHPGFLSTSSQISTRSSNISSSHKSSRAAAKEPLRSMTEAKVYKCAVECPICFLYYPPNINRSRCCDHAICTECFVQIKRNEPTPTHLVSEPACCPYCVQPNFGIVYTPPSWRAGIGADSPIRPELLKVVSSTSDSSNASGGPSRGRRKSTSHTSVDVVTIDQIRPDWEAKLNAVKATVARRANRRIIMRQVGDRLIPIGVTSGRVLPIGEAGSGAANGSADGDSSGRRSRRRGNQPPVGGELGQLLNSMGMVMGGQDLEDLLLQEAMRLSLIEHEAEQRRNQQGGQNNESTNAATPDLPPSGEATPSNPSLTSLALDRGREDSPAPSSRPESPRARSASPGAGRNSSEHDIRRRSHIPIVPSPLGTATAGIAMAIGLPSSPTSVRGNLNVPPPAASNGHSRNASQASSRSHSRHPSHSTLAAAISAASTAMAFIPADDSTTSAAQHPMSNSTGSPHPPSPGLDKENKYPGSKTHHADLDRLDLAGSASGASTGHLSTTVKTSGASTSNANAMVGSVDNADGLDPTMSSDTTSSNPLTPYHVLPSTPDLDATQPLLPEDNKDAQSQMSVPVSVSGSSWNNQAA